jgi:hypothetical protein
MGIFIGPATLAHSVARHTALTAHLRGEIGTPRRRVVVTRVETGYVLAFESESVLSLEQIEPLSSCRPDRNDDYFSSNLCLSLECRTLIRLSTSQGRVTAKSSERADEWEGSFFDIGQEIELIGSYGTASLR